MKVHNITPSELFQVLDVENEEEALKVFEAAFSFLLYLKVGDELRLSSMTIKKISDDLVRVESDTSGPDVIDFLARKRIIRLPV
jgi:hypothetical protein